MREHWQLFFHFNRGVGKTHKATLTTLVKRQQQWQWHTGFPLKSTLEHLRQPATSLPYFPPDFESTEGKQKAVVPHLHLLGRLFRFEIRRKWALAFSASTSNPSSKPNERRNEIEKRSAWQLTSSRSQISLMTSFHYNQARPRRGRQKYEKAAAFELICFQIMELKGRKAETYPGRLPIQRETVSYFMRCSSRKKSPSHVLFFLA